MVDVAVPDMPLTTPVPATTVATEVVLLLHAPSGVVLLRAVVWPTHVVSEPVIGFGNGLTVIFLVLKQPAPAVYVTSQVPTDEPDNIPVVTPIVAYAQVIDQVPPAGVQFRVDVPDTHTFAPPVIRPGNALMVTIAVFLQPVGKV